MQSSPNTASARSPLSEMIDVSFGRSPGKKVPGVAQRLASWKPPSPTLEGIENKMQRAEQQRVSKQRSPTSAIKIENAATMRAIHAEQLVSEQKKLNDRERNATTQHASKIQSVLDKCASAEKKRQQARERAAEQVASAQKKSQEREEHAAAQHASNIKSVVDNCASAEKKRQQARERTSAAIGAQQAVQDRRMRLAAKSRLVQQQITKDKAAQAAIKVDNVQQKREEQKIVLASKIEKKLEDAAERRHVALQELASPSKLRSAAHTPQAAKPSSVPSPPTDITSSPDASQSTQENSSEPQQRREQGHFGAKLFKFITSAFD